MDLMKCTACICRVSNFKECIRHSRIEKAGEISLLHVGGMVSATKTELGSGGSLQQNVLCGGIPNQRETWGCF